MISHKLMYPEQYEHPLVDKLVRTKDQTVFRVERVVDSRYGKLAIVPGSKKAYSINDVEIIKEN